MNEDRKTGSVGPAGSGRKHRWNTPTLSRIEASTAEVGTRNQVDGNFTSS